MRQTSSNTLGLHLHLLWREQLGGSPLNKPSLPPPKRVPGVRPQTVVDTDDAVRVRVACNLAQVREAVHKDVRVPDDS